MVCLVWLAMPGEALDALGAWRQRSRAQAIRLARVRARAVARLGRWLPARRRGPLLAPSWQHRARVLREVLLGYMLLVEGASVLASNRAVPRPLRLQPGALLRGYKPYLRAQQSWSMFAPDAPTDDGTLVIDAVTRAGRHLDPFNGRDTDFEQIRRGLDPHSVALCDYFLAMRNPANARYRLDLARYVRSRPAATPEARFVALEVWWVGYEPPPRGSHEPGPLRKERLWRMRLTR
jgi:hypothetical protein